MIRSTLFSIPVLIANAAFLVLLPRSLARRQLPGAERNVHHHHHHLDDSRARREWRGAAAGFRWPRGIWAPRHFH